MKLQKITFSMLTLITVNIVPLIGVLFFDWSTAIIVFLYWIENITIGFYNILKLAFVKDNNSPAKLFAIIFFIIHFGGFCAGHGFFLFGFFKLESGLSSFFLKVIWSVIFLFVSHGISFLQNYIRKQEYASLNIAKLMIQPYKRIVILHITIIFGAVPIMLLGSPVPLLCILVLLKICVDIRMHMKEHKISNTSESNQQIH